MRNINEKGVTLVALIITIIILLILSGVSITIGGYSIDSYKNNALESEIRMVQTAVMSQYEKYITTKDVSLLVGEQCSESGNINATTKEYNLLEPEDLEKIGMENLKDAYIVNYKTGEVINKTSTKSDGTILKLNGTSN